MRYLKFLITAVIVVAVVVFAKGYLKKKQTEIASLPTPKESSVYVDTIKAKSSKLEQKMNFIATVEANKEVTISTKLAGYIEKISKDESQYVKKGELLAKIDSQGILSNINSLQSLLNSQTSDYKTAQKIYERNKKLYHVGGLPLEKLELSKIAVNMKKSTLNNSKSKIAQLRNDLNYLNIKSPIDGIVDVVMLHEGDLAPAGKPILKVSSKNKKLTFLFAPKYKEQILNRDVLYNSKTIGKVSKIYNIAKNSLIIAEVKLTKNINLINNTNVDIELLVDSKSGCTLPSSAIIHKSDGTYIMVYDGAKFVKQKVKLQLEDNSKAIIEPCPKSEVAIGNENFLSTLPTLGKVKIRSNK